MSSCVWFVPLLFAAPTAMTIGSYAGSLSFVEPKPPLPAATTTVIPLRQATSTAYVSGSSP